MVRLKIVGESKKKNLDSRGGDRVQLAQADLINNEFLQEYENWSFVGLHSKWSSEIHKNGVCKRIGTVW